MSQIQIFRINLSKMKNEKGYIDDCHQAMNILYNHLTKDDFAVVYIHKDETDLEEGGSVFRIAHPDIPFTIQTMLDEFKKIYNL